MKTKSIILVFGLGLFCVGFAGCDLGTYSKRLGETNVQPPAEPVEEEPAEDGAADN